MKKSVSKKAITWTVAAAVTAAPTESARPWIAPVLYGLSIASSIVGMGGRGNNADFEGIMSAMRMVEQLGNRLTAIENTLATILKKIDAFPEEIRKALTEDADKRRVEDAMAISETLRPLIAGIPAAKRKGMLKAQLQAVDGAFVNFQIARRALFKRSDLVVPAIVSALATEISALDASDLSLDTQEILKEYYAQLEKVDSLDRPDSLASLMKNLEAERESKEKELAALITKKPTDALSGGSYVWYLHTKVHTEEREEEVSRRRNGMTSNFAGANPDTTSTVKKTVYVADHTRALSWVVSKEAVQDENGAGLYYFKVGTSVTETKGGSNAVEPHTGSDDAYETGHHQDDIKQLKEKAADYEAIVDAITSVRRLQAIAAAGRAIIVKWNTNNARDLAHSVREADLNTSKLLNDVKSRREARETEQRIDEMAEQRRRFDEVTAEGYQRVKAVAELARREKWRSDFRNYAALAQQSYQFTVALKASLPTDTPSTPAGGAATNDYKLTEPKTQKAPSQDHQQPANEIGKKIGWSLTERPLVLENHLKAALADVDKHRASSWKEIPKQLTQQEIELMEVQQTLQSLHETEADKVATSAKDQLTGAATDIATGLGKGGVSGALKSALVDSVKPVYVGDDGPLGAESRRLLQVETQKRMQEFFEARFGKFGEIRIDPSTVCIESPGCLRAATKHPTPK
jgi:hypothetical protein